MPEGHSIHRYARLHRSGFAGRRLRVSSPQGRFSAGAAELDGRTLTDVEAVGKHLFYRWEGGRILHVHLGLFGRFRTHRADPPPPTAGTRLAMCSDDAVLYLSGPTRCALIDREDEAAIRDRLGPDPLAVGTDGAGEFARRLARRRVPVGAALLDQRVAAGVGNVYRAEVLFLAGIHPDVPAAAVDPGAARALWDGIVEQLRAGERRGRIVTVDPAEVGAATVDDLDRSQRLYVYRRDGLPCRRCGTPVARWELAARAIWACRACQPEP